MAFIMNDFKNAIVDYPSTGVDLSIVSAAQNTGSGNSVNANEIWKFKVHVQNRGWVNMTNVMLHVNGKNGATVATSAAGPFGTNTVTVGPLTVNSGNGRDSAYVYFKAPGAAQPTADLVESHIAEWDADLSSILIGQSGHASIPSATYPAEVFPA